jgi:hypothetical protein
MANKVQYIDVAEPEQMQMEVTRLLSAGYTVANQNNRSVTLVKRKQFSIPMLIIGFLLCLVPLLIYLIVYAMQSDQIVEIRLIDRPQAKPYRASDHIAIDGERAAPPANAPVIQLTPDGNQWWDGSQWQATATSAPPHAARKPDGSEWWDGQAWRVVPRG